MLEPLGEDSPIAAFLAKNPSGGMHHVCYEVDDILAARDRLKASGARVLGDGKPKIGAHGKPVLFLHPKDFAGTLVELEQAWAEPLGSRQMTYISVAALFFILWWMVLFAALPFGLKTQDDDGERTRHCFERAARARICCAPSSARRIVSVLIFGFLRCC